MNSPQIRAIACKALMDAGVRRLPVHIKLLAQRLGVSIFTYTQYADTVDCSVSDVAQRYGCDGFTQRIGGRVAVFYYQSTNLRRVRWTIAHELGHVLLGHLSGGVDEDDADRQADAMAAELLCPSVIAAARVCYYPQEISRMCDISLPAAAVRARDLITWQNVMLPQEEELLYAMEDFIEEETEVVWGNEAFFAPLPQLRSHRI